MTNDRFQSLNADQRMALNYLRRKVGFCVFEDEGDGVLFWFHMRVILRYWRKRRLTSSPWVPIAAYLFEIDADECHEGSVVGSYVTAIVGAFLDEHPGMTSEQLHQEVISWEWGERQMGIGR